PVGFGNGVGGRGFRRSYGEIDLCGDGQEENSRLELLVRSFRDQVFSAGDSWTGDAGDAAAGWGAGVAGTAGASPAASADTTGSGLAATCGPKPKASSLRAETIMRTMLVGTISSSSTPRPCESWPCRVISTSAPPVSISWHTTWAPAAPSCR